MPSDIEAFLSACKRYGLLLDTNMLVLLAVGNKNKSDIPHHKRTSIYTPEEYDFLLHLLRISDLNIHITPQIIAEVSNHLIDAKQKTGRASTPDRKHFEATKALIEGSTESYFHKDIILKLPELNYLGITDLSIMELAKETGCAIVTSDGLLYDQLLAKGYPAAHFQNFYAFYGSRLSA